MLFLCRKVSRKNFMFLHMMPLCLWKDWQSGFYSASIWTKLLAVWIWIRGVKIFSQRTVAKLFSEAILFQSHVTYPFPISEKKDLIRWIHRMDPPHEISFCTAKTSNVSALECQLQPPTPVLDIANKAVTVQHFACQCFLPSRLIVTCPSQGLGHPSLLMENEDITRGHAGLKCSQRDVTKIGFSLCMWTKCFPKISARLLFFSAIQRMKISLSLCWLVAQFVFYPTKISWILADSIFLSFLFLFFFSS